MPALSVVFPVVPGKEEALKEFGKSLETEKKSEFDISQKRIGVRKEMWALQRTAQASLAIVYFEASDPLQSLAKMTQSKDPFDLWFKKQVSTFTGVDVSQGLVGPVPETFLSYGYE
jgi:hypothetical protein